MLSQKTVQHEAVLATLAALSHPPAPERLYPSLRPSLPQLLGLGQLRDGAWAGSLPPPAGLTPPWRRRARRVVPSRCRWTRRATGWWLRPAGACCWTRASCCRTATSPTRWPT